MVMFLSASRARGWRGRCGASPDALRLEFHNQWDKNKVAVVSRVPGRGLMYEFCCRVSLSSKSHRLSLPFDWCGVRLGETS